MVICEEPKDRKNSHHNPYVNNSYSTSGTGIEMFPFEDLITKHILQYFAELNPGQMMTFTYHQE